MAGEVFFAQGKVAGLEEVMSGNVAVYFFWGWGGVKHELTDQHPRRIRSCQGREEAGTV
jgi:hypothetical protein